MLLQKAEKEAAAAAAKEAAAEQGVPTAEEKGKGKGNAPATAQVGSVSWPLVIGTAVHKTWHYPHVTGNLPVAADCYRLWTTASCWLAESYCII